MRRILSSKISFLFLALVMCFTLANCGNENDGPVSFLAPSINLDTEEAEAEEEAVCGNGIIEDMEECDDGNDIDDDACTNTCTEAFCGDGMTNDGEECDDGNDINDDACTNACTATFCGDGVINNDEECDDVDLNEMVCSDLNPDLYSTGTLTCDVNCTFEESNCSSGTCCNESNTASECNVPDILACICPLDPFCCNIAWDNICVSEAINICGAVCAP